MNPISTIVLYIEAVAHAQTAVPHIKTMPSANVLETSISLSLSQDLLPTKLQVLFVVHEGY